jgi:lactate 2-monooxygenase
MNLEYGRQFGDYQNEIYLGGLSGVLPTMPMAFAELEARAQATLSSSLLSYVAGGAGDESTQQANVSAFLQWGLVPRMMVGATWKEPTASFTFCARCWPRLT